MANGVIRAGKQVLFNHIDVAKNSRLYRREQVKLIAA